MRRLLTWLKPWPAGLALPLLLFVLAGCSDSYPTASGTGDGGGYAPPSAPDKPLLASGDNDPLGGDDPLQASHGTLSDSDSLTPDHGVLDDTGPSDADDDPLGSGRPMPTDHSHWLDGTISSARVTVELNHTPYGQFDAPVDRDITMHIRRGVNTVTFKFTPEGAMAAANLQLEESEHDPPIPPLAVFCPPLPLNGQTPQPLTRTFTFIAH